MKLKKWSILLVLVFAMSIFLAACAGDDSESSDGNDSGDTEETEDSGSDSSEGSEDSGSSEDSEGSDGEGELAADQTFDINIKSEPPSLHPGLATDTTSGAVLDQVFEGLMRINQEGEVEEAMAESYEMSEDQTTYTFKIREDATWSNGDPVTAQDFEYAWEWVLDPDNADTDYAYQLYVIKGAQAAKEEGGSIDDVGITAEDDQTLVVELAQPTPYFLDLTAFYTYYPVNHNVVDGNDEWAQDVTENYVTNGPFTLESWEHKNQIVLKKNPDYWDAETVKLETVNMYMVDDENTALEMYNSGELDWAGDPTDSLPLAAIPSLTEDGSLNLSSLAGVYYYSFNTEESPFDNVNIRKAFASAINREGIVQSITQREEQPAMALVPPSIWEENNEGYFADNDPEAAKEYLETGLEELGLDELPAVKLSYNTSEAHAAIAQAVQAMWKENLGVEVELNNEEWNVYLDSMGAGNYQIGRMGWLADFNDAINFLEIFQSVGGNNYTNWESEEYSDLIEQSRTETDDAARKDILRQAEQIFMDDMPIAPVYFYTNAWLSQDYVHGIEVSPLGGVQFKWGYLTEQ
ncbi:ABC transporter substrate-binding protein [Virgibacillus profundi]|uniref:ABC transporter substrate-binding protein n=1 Tax=Virgibacillus profundi TaxID=2024555 RepID=A0A2A2IK19_9BACI|nr:peptide ABC transporter substrate-binding protein [Virgibacillus profundi]PAV31465.1 ABC transporter substrate-binding protein [Virgibacillus profundi]PXY55651.1 peptide ABC transporter substrate-binding protein [Virgibacillus profundi]